MYATERVELAAKARVQGNVHYKVVEMRAGATLTGRLIHADAADGGRAGCSDVWWPSQRLTPRRPLAPACRSRLRLTALGYHGSR